MAESQTLKQMLLEDIPPNFVKDLVDGMPGIYADTSQAMTADPGLGETQARYCLGYYRRSRVETFLQRLAVKHGIKHVERQPEGGGPSHISVYVGRFELVMCHVPSADGFPQHSLDRQEASKANEFIAQMDWVGEPEAPSTSRLYGVIIHSEQYRQKDTFGHIKVGFPNTDFNAWVEAPICLVDMRDIQARQLDEVEDIQALVQKDSVRWKTGAKEEDRKSG
ncbi:hypothetical protein GCM10027297_34100 [Parahaliea aestuarii]